MSKNTKAKPTKAKKPVKDIKSKKKPGGSTKTVRAEIIVVLDRSGSMRTIAKDMMGGFDTFIDEQRKAIPGKCSVTLAQFDNEYELVYENKPLADVPRLNLIPGGSTALYDAVGKTLSAVTARWKTEGRTKADKTTFVIITDGQENASREYTSAHVKDMIESARKEYDCQFIFIGADERATFVATGIGIAAASAIHFDNNKIGTEALMRGVSTSNAIYMTSCAESATLDFDQKAYARSVAEVTEEHDKGKKSPTFQSAVAPSSTPSTPR